MLYSFVGTIANISLAEKKLGIVNWSIKGKKSYVFARQLPHIKTYVQVKYPLINSHWTFLVGTWIWLWSLTDILLKGLLSDGNPRILSLHWPLSSLGFCSVSSDKSLRCQIYLFIFRVDYGSHFFVYILFKKDSKIKKSMKYSEKNEFINERWEGPTIKLWRGSWGPTFKLYGGPGSHFYTLRGVPGPGILVPHLQHAFWWTSDHLWKYNKKMEETFAHQRSKFIVSK